KCASPLPGRSFTLRSRADDRAATRMTAEGVRALVVETDDVDFVITRQLLEQGFSPEHTHAALVVERAATAEQGIERLVNGDFDVALVDSYLGAESGIDVLRAARARG